MYHYAGFQLQHMAITMWHVLQALSPHYCFRYFVRNGLTGWESLGGIVLTITDMSTQFSELLLLVTACAAVCVQPSM